MKNLSNRNQTKVNMASRRLTLTFNGNLVVKKYFDEKGRIFIIRLKNQEMPVLLTNNLIKSLHNKKDDTYGFVDFENEMVNGCRVVKKSYVENGENGQCFVLNLDCQVMGSITISMDLVNYLHDNYNQLHYKYLLDKF